MTKLIELGGDPACRDNEGRSCLHLAANNDSPSAVRILLQYKVRELQSYTFRNNLASCISLKLFTLQCYVKSNQLELLCSRAHI